MKDLNSLQRWMMKAIITPPGNHPGKLAQDKLAKEAARYLTASPPTASHVLTARQRLEIYVGDFWPRCLDSLAEDFPGLKHYLGYAAFESWMKKYVAARPADSFTLRDLGQKLEGFMRRTYGGTRNKAVVLDIIRTEWSRMAAANQKELPPYDPALLTDKQKSHLATLRLRLQPHLHLFELTHNIPRWLAAKKGRPLKAKTSVITYRSPAGVRTEAIEEPFYVLLSAFGKGVPLSQAVDRVVARAGKRVTETKMRAWIEECIRKGWLTVWK